MVKNGVVSGLQVAGKAFDSGSEGGPLQAHLERVMDYLPSGVLLTDQTGKLVGYNKAAEDILGEISFDVKPEDWPRLFGLYEGNTAAVYPVNRLPLLRALTGENAPREELTRVNGNGEAGRTWLTMSAKPVLSPEGKIDGALVYLQDITAQKLVELARERKLRQAEAFYTFSRAISQYGNDLVRILEALVKFTAETIGDGCIVALLNQPGDKLRTIAYHHDKPHARELLQRSGLSRDYALQGAIERVIHTGEPLLVPEVDLDRLRKRALPEQLRYIDEIGLQSLLVVPIKGRFGVMGTLSLFRDRGGQTYTEDDQAYIQDVSYRTGLAIDNNALVHSLRLESSGRRIAEEALEQSEVRFRSIFASTALGIKILDLDGTIVETNPAFQHMLGFSEQELAGTLITKYWYPPDSMRLQQLIKSMKNNQIQSYRLEHRLVAKDGSPVWVNATFTSIPKNERDNAPEFIVALVEDITRRKLMEAEMTEMKNRLENHLEMERLKMAQEIHDGALQDLYSMIYRIEEGRNSTPQEDSEVLRTFQQDLLHVIGVLRNTAKDLRPPALVDFGLEKAIRSHASDFVEAHPELKIHLDLASDMQALPEDIRLIVFRIYQHSLANVLRHAQASNVYVKFAFDAEQAYLEIRDDGQGFVVPSSWVELVRQGHYGLAGAVERVSLLGGTFTIESSPGSGATAKVTLPFHESPSYQPEGE